MTAIKDSQIQQDGTQLILCEADSESYAEFLSNMFLASRARADQSVRALHKEEWRVAMRRHYDALIRLAIDGYAEPHDTADRNSEFIRRQMVGK